MSLLHPTLGELLDRYTIVELKRRYAPEIRHFQEEQIELLDAIGTRWDAPEFPQLRFINQKLWDANEILAHEEEDQVEGLARQIWIWNLERARLVEAINRRVGEFVGPEKI